MSELRDLTNALRSFDKRISSMEECMVILVRNSEQQADWRHEQRNAAQLELASREGTRKSVAQMGIFLGSLWDYLAKLDERLSALAVSRVDDVKALSRRVRELEQKVGDQDEVTQA